MDTVDHHFVINQTKIDIEIIEADQMYLHLVLVLSHSKNV